MKTMQLTDWLAVEKKSVTQYGIITNMDWCNREKNRIQKSGREAWIKYKRVLNSTMVAIYVDSTDIPDYHGRL